MNNLSSYCGLVDAKIKASDKDLLVIQARHHKVFGFNVLCNTVVLGCIALAAVVYGTITYIITYAYLLGVIG